MFAVEMHGDTWARTERPWNWSRKTENIAGRQFHDDGDLIQQDGARSCDVEVQRDFGQDGGRGAALFPTERFGSRCPLQTMSHISLQTAIFTLSTLSLLTARNLRTTEDSTFSSFSVLAFTSDVFIVLFAKGNTIFIRFQLSTNTISQFTLH